MVNIHCKYITHCFPCCCFKCLSFPFYDVSLSQFFLGMSKVQTPSPHASKKHDKRCDNCHAYVSELDPHPVCQKCVPRECSRELPCSHCASLSMDAWKKWERQQASRRSSSAIKGIRPRGGANLGRQRPLRGIAQMLLQPPRLSLLVGRDWQPWNQAFRPSGRKWPPCFASLQGRLTASHPPGPETDESRHCDGGARGGETCPDDPLASQQPCLGLLGPEALPLVGRAPGCDLSDPSHVMEPRCPASHTAMAMDPVHGLQSGFGQTGVTLNTQRGRAALRSGYGS